MIDTPHCRIRAQFAQELWAKIPRQAKVDPVVARMEAEKKAREQMIKARSYALIDDDVDAAPASSTAKTVKQDTKAGKNIRKRTVRMSIRIYFSK